MAEPLLARMLVAGRHKVRAAAVVVRMRGGVLVVGLDDALDEAVAHDVMLVEIDERDSFDSCRRISMASTRPERRESGKSIWVTSPVITALELNPSRVRNIFICSLVVFCASSRITNESFSVRPRMKASGATSIIPFSR